jgi:hypothetical protein
MTNCLANVLGVSGTLDGRGCCTDVAVTGGHFRNRELSRKGLGALCLLVRKDVINCFLIL